jgi:hypothetical protein
MTRSLLSNTFMKFSKRPLEGTEESVPEPKEGIVAVLKLSEAVGLN